VVGLALAIVFLWVAGLLLWIAFHNLDTLKTETSGLPGVLSAIVAYVQGGSKPASTGSSAQTPPLSTVPSLPGIPA
jgi:hypothetical protein